MRIFVLVLLITGLSACSVRTCEFDGEYLQAREYPELKNPDNGELPSRDPAYQLPPAPQQEYKSGRTYTNAEGEAETDCLDKPPRLISKQS